MFHSKQMGRGCCVLSGGPIRLFYKSKHIDPISNFAMEKARGFFPPCDKYIFFGGGMVMIRKSKLFTFLTTCLIQVHGKDGSCPSYLRQTLEMFKSLLKMHLFSKAFQEQYHSQLVVSFSQLLVVLNLFLIFVNFIFIYCIF